MPEDHQERADAERQIKRNPHGDFNQVQASRQKFDETRKFEQRQTRKPDWKLGQGATDGGESLRKNHVEIDPYESGRPATFNYKLLISAIVPRPVGFVSTISKDGSSTNLAPFSYFQMVCHDPPVFIIGFSGSQEKAKDTLRNLIDTGECVINIISEHFIEAANSTSINAPFGVSEWTLSGLHQAPSSQVKPSRVKESIFSVEGKLMGTTEFESRVTAGKKTAVMATIEGIRFWAREDAINEDRNLIDPDILRPMSRLGGITYGRVLDALEIPRPDFDEATKGKEDLLERSKAKGQ